MTLVNPLDTREVIRPRTVAEALVHLQQANKRPVPLAGGMSLLEDTASGLPVLLDLTLLEWRYVRAEDAGLRIGATTPLQDLVEHPEVRSWAGGVLSEAARWVAPSVQRHQLTVGGLLAADRPDDELTSALIALDAQIEYSTPSHRDVPLAVDVATFAQGNRPDEPFLVSSIIVPVDTQQWRGTLERLGRTARDRAIVHVTVAAEITAEGWHHVHVVVGGVGAPPVRLPAAEHAIGGLTDLTDQEAFSQVETAVREAWPAWDDWRASAEYRRHVAAVLTRRAVTVLQQMA